MSAHEELAHSEAFIAATEYVGAASTSGSLTDSQLLKFYGLYKQATSGSCTIPRPSWFDRKGTAKWNAWRSCGDVSQLEAQAQYVQLLSELIPKWQSSTSNSGGSGRGGKQSGAGGPVSSRMADVADEEPDGCPQLLQAARSGDTAAVQGLLQQGQDVNQRGSEGETALHWAADRGQLSVLSVLLAHGADLSAADDDGMTALHYAAVADQRAAAQLLLAHGLDAGLQNGSGETAAQLAPADWVFL